jgi:hypothetical protein
LPVYSLKRTGSSVGVAMKSVYCILFLFSMTFFSAVEATAQIPSRFAAMLVSGPVLAKGVPGFGSNAIPCLQAVYESNGETIRVFAVEEKLLFGPSWRKGKAGKYAVFITDTDDGHEVRALAREILMRDEMKAHSKWYFVAEFSAVQDEAWKTAFLSDFIERTEFFFSVARYQGDLSFPATIKASIEP